MKFFERKLNSTNRKVNEIVLKPLLDFLNYTLINLREDETTQFKVLVLKLLSDPALIIHLINLRNGENTQLKVLVFC